jgi:CTP synthase (UTP-ammonia lyase)
MFEAIQPSLPILLISIGIVVVLVIAKSLLDKQTPSHLPYKVKPSILTSHEQKYFRQLESQYRSTHYIFCQVALDRIINTTDQKNFYTYWNKINKKSIDFVLVDKQTLQTVKLIELNDKTHSCKSRIIRDDFLKQVCATAGIELEFKTI